MKNSLIFLSLILLWSTTLTAHAAVELSSGSTYTCGDGACLFQGNLPFLSSGGDWTFEDYVNGFFNLAISLAAILVVFRLMMAGVKYMFSEVITNKTKAREDMKNAILGLLIILGAVTILKTINPRILDINILSNLPDLSESQDDWDDYMADHTPPPSPPAPTVDSGESECGDGYNLVLTTVDGGTHGTCQPSAGNLNNGRPGDSVPGTYSGTISDIYTRMKDEGLYSGVNTQEAFIAWENRCASLGGVVTSDNNTLSGNPRYNCVYP